MNKNNKKTKIPKKSRNIIVHERLMWKVIPLVHTEFRNPNFRVWDQSKTIYPHPSAHKGEISVTEQKRENRINRVLFLHHFVAFFQPHMNM